MAPSPRPGTERVDEHGGTAVRCVGRRFKHSGLRRDFLDVHNGEVDEQPSGAPPVMSPNSCPRATSTVRSSAGRCVVSCPKIPCRKRRPPRDYRCAARSSTARRRSTARSRAVRSVAAARKRPPAGSRATATSPVGVTVAGDTTCPPSRRITSSVPGTSSTAKYVVQVCCPASGFHAAHLDHRADWPLVRERPMILVRALAHIPTEQSTVE
jgi:hypothetical protein